MVKPKQYKQSVMTTVTNSIVAIVSAVIFFFCALLGVALDGSARWFPIAFACAFGASGIVFAGFVARPLRLTLDSSGLTLSGGWMRSPRFVAWRDIDGPMTSYSVGRGEAIGYNLVESSSNCSRWAGYRRDNFLLLPEANLPDVWRVSAEQLADEINAYRMQALRGTD